MGDRNEAPVTAMPNPLQLALARMGLPTADFAGMTGALGVTPKETIHAQGTLKLHHFTPVVDDVYRVPVLIVTSLVNQPYILDLVPQQSMVGHLLAQGFDVYMIEWGRPRQAHKHLTLEDHVLDRLPACVARVLEHSGQKKLSIIGYCVGGLLAVLRAALHAGPRCPLKNLVCMATPVDSDGLESLKAWMGPDFDEEALLARHGNVPGDWVVGGRRVDLGAIDMPFLHLLAQDDHITPYASSHPLLGRVGSRDKQELIIRGGHVGLVAGRGAQTRMWPALEAWLAPRSV